MSDPFWIAHALHKTDKEDIKRSLNQVKKMLERTQELHSRTTLLRIRKILKAAKWRK